jgi:1-acyl-sn-glycerol-3-phosphate acyltransferase
MVIPKPTSMESVPRSIPPENAGTDTRCGHARRPVFFRQFAAHVFAVYQGLGLTARAAFTGGGADPVEERRKLGRRFHRYRELLSDWGLVEAEFSGFEDAAKWRGSVIAANHPSIFDAVLLLSILPEMDCIMNSRLLRDPVMSGAAKLCGYIRNDSRFSMVRGACRALSEGRNLLVFPEGTRSTAWPTGPFRHGFALAASRCAAPIRTVLIECDSDYFGRGFRFFRPAKDFPIRFRIATGPVFWPDQNEDPRRLSSRIQRFFADSLAPHRT